MSTFHGLEMAKQALYAQQSALYTTGHNIANANTEGYSRQRVNFETMPAYPSGSRNRPQLPGQIGTGVKTGSIERIRDMFLDNQFRAENSKAGYWEAKSEALSRMENVLNETNDSGLSKSMELFWSSLQDLAVTPENSGARSVVVQNGVAVAETFKHLSGSLKTIQKDIQSQIDGKIKDANSLLREIHAINEQLQKIEPHGYLANDLYDERDRLVDQLSTIVNIQVTYTPSSDRSPKTADGLATIELVDDNGQPVGITLLQGKPGDNEDPIHPLTLNKDTHAVEIDGQKLPMTTNGSLNALITANEVDYPEMLQKLDDMAAAFISAFNAVHEAGFGIEGQTGNPFFTGTNASDIDVSQAIKDNPGLVAASENGKAGDGKNALALSGVFDQLDVGLGEKVSIKGFYESVIGELGVNAREANRQTKNTMILLSQVDNQRMSVSAVSLDEEMSNMIKFQHAFNAAARNMTTIDEMLDRIINSMGLVGR